MRENQGADSPIDRLVLTGAALRLRLKTLRDQLEAGLGGRVEEESEAALALAEELMRRFDDEITGAEARAWKEWVAEARALRVLLMRDYSVLWLELHGSP